jgi:hypothetical protein
MIGDWLRGDSDEQEVQWIPGHWIGGVDIGTLPEQLSRRGRIARRDLFDLAGQVTAGCGDHAVMALLIGVAAFTTACSICRLPISGPHLLVIAACASSNDPRTASSAASRARV